MEKVVEKKICLSEWYAFFWAHEKTPAQIYEIVLDEVRKYPQHVIEKAKNFVLGEKYKSNGGGLFITVKAKKIGNREVWTGDNLCLTHPDYEPDPVPKAQGYQFCESEYHETFNAGGGRVTAGYTEEEWFEVLEWGELEQIK